ncbi:single-stranded-DNA-specific exonuclease RecJ [Candidatus Gottesmanbacteria bacterium]|nr:single-stranded-DNA-specific exonuclease RecJ [Candidatus Gottesmanbacteria bacterium]
MKKWLILGKYKKDNRKQLTEKEVMQILLKNRGLTKKKEINEFLDPSLDQLTAENLGIRIKELNKAVERIKQAIDNKESVVVYTDYDADGLCGGAIVWESLYYLLAKVMPYVPHRQKEGYGLSKHGIDFVKKTYQTRLIITVDHGISAADQIDYAKKIGIETIIIDHHILPSKQPNAAAVIHTTKLAAGGIAWFFSNYLLSKFSVHSSLKFTPVEPFSHPRGGPTSSAVAFTSSGEGRMDSPGVYLSIRNLDLAAMATIADLVPLTGANRAIVKHGLDQLNKTKRIGLNALISEAGLKKGKIGVYEVGYMLIPRINAVGRLTNALDALRLICTRDDSRAIKLARILSLINRERQILMEETTAHAISNVQYQILNNRKNQKSEKLIFISHKSYKEGIIGLVAGKLVEQFGRPAIVVSQGREYSKASARSINGFNIVQAIRQVSYLLEDVGGHPMAAGFTLATNKIEKIKRRLTQIANTSITEKNLEKVIKIDLEINLSEVSLELYSKIQELAPFGVANPQPVFASRKVRVVRVSSIGKKQKHIKLLLRQDTDHITDNGNKLIDAIGFGMGDYYDRLSSGTLIDVAFVIDRDEWNNDCRLQLKLKDVKFTA